MKNRFPYSPLPALILLLALILRVYRLGTQALFLDEAWSWVASQLPGNGIFALLANDPHPVLYYLLLKASLRLLPASEAGLRALSVVFSVAAVALLLWSAPRWFGRRAAWFAGFLAAISSFDIYYAQEARMYTLLAFLWLLSFLALLAAFSGQQQAFLLWGAVNFALVWTHFYGVLVVAAHLGIALILWGTAAHRAGESPPSVSRRFLFWGVGMSCAALLSLFPLLWQYKFRAAGGAWIPKLADLAYLWGGFSVGLPAVRLHFLDSVHLVLPGLERIPLWGWSLLGVVWMGGLVLWGGFSVWRDHAFPRWVVLATLASAGLPIAVAFLYAAVFQRAMWAYKPFIGAMYLFFLLAGVGCSNIAQGWLRNAIVAASVGFAVCSLLPYYTVWQKSNARAAFQTIPNTGMKEVVLLERPYVAPLAWYYLGADAPLLGVNAYDPAHISLVALRFGDGLVTRPRQLPCDDVFLSAVKSLRIYGAPARVRNSYRNWPPCVLTKELWLFESGAWRKLHQ